MNTHLSLEEIIVELSIYSSFSVKLYDASNEKAKALTEEAKSLFCELFFCDKVDIKCVECDKEHPFDVKHKTRKENYKDVSYICVGIMGNHYSRSIDDSDLITSNIVFPEHDEGIISYLFTCTMEPSHYQTMDLLYVVKSDTIEIRKIGQKPINIVLRDSLSNEYERVLNKYDSFDDYRRYEQSESRNLLAGACTYLRRIFEKNGLCKIISI